MGERLGTLFHELWNELVWLNVKWCDYRTLFETSKDRFNEMNTVAPRCMYFVQAAMWRDVLIHICRMTDPEQSCGKPNISLNALVPLIDDIECREGVRLSADRAAEVSEFARQRRNRYFAHKDLLTARNAHPVPLEAVDRESVGKALSAIADTMNILHKRYENATCMYDFVEGMSDAESLYEAIASQAAKIEKERDELRRRLDEFGGST